MTERGTDIEFDFFDEPETEEAPARARPARRRGGPRPPIRPPTGFTPLLRLVGLITFAIVIVVLLVLWVDSCRSADKRETYSDYMEKLGTIASDSEQVGRELNAALTTPGVKRTDLQQTIAGLADQQDQDVTAARDLEPPGRLRAQHDAAILALQFRVSGLEGLRTVLGEGTAIGNAAQVGDRMAAEMRRLVASDVIWDDRVVVLSRDVLQSEGAGGVDPPDSNFLTNPDLSTGAAMTPIWRRIQGASTGGTPTGRHGHGLVSVKALPKGQVLEEGTENIVVATADLAFEVTIENSGESQEVRVKVTLEIEQSPQPITKEAVIDLINPGERKTLVFRDLGQIVTIGQKTTMRVEIGKVPGEQFLRNNAATYTVTFSLTP